MLLMIVTFLVGYGIALPIPDRFGSKGLLKAAWLWAGLNLLFQLVFKMLPLTGVMNYTLFMYVTPEMALVTGNIERLDAAAGLLEFRAVLGNLLRADPDLVELNRTGAVRRLAADHCPGDEERCVGRERRGACWRWRCRWDSCKWPLFCWPPEAPRR